MLGKKVLKDSLGLLKTLIRLWPLTLLVCLAYGAALYFLGFNFTSSLPYYVVWIERGVVPKTGDLMVYYYSGMDLKSYGYIKGIRFFKRVAGKEGDTIAVNGRQVSINGKLVGEAKPFANHGAIKLDPIDAGTIPKGYLFAQGDSPNSFDSRYKQSGLVPLNKVQGVAHVIF